jgi:hypothetical protein
MRNQHSALFSIMSNAYTPYLYVSKVVISLLVFVHMVTIIPAILRIDEIPLDLTYTLSCD